MANKICDDELTYEKLGYFIDKEQIRFQYKNHLQLRYRYINLFLKALGYTSWT